MYTYFVYFAIYLTDNSITEMSAVRELATKLDSRDSLSKLHAELVEELNKQLLMNGQRVTNIIIKNFILINETICLAG